MDQGFMTPSSHTGDLKCRYGDYRVTDLPPDQRSKVMGLLTPDDTPQDDAMQNYENSKTGYVSSSDQGTESDSYLSSDAHVNGSSFGSVDGSGSEQKYLHRVGSPGTVARAKLEPCGGRSSGLSASQSFVWISEEEAMRTRYRTSAANLHHMRCDQSPGVPRSFEEWLDIKASYLEDRIKYYKKYIDDHQRAIDHRRAKHGRVVPARSPQIRPQIPLSSTLGPISRNASKQNDFSMDVARHSLWHIDCTEDIQAQWPCRRERKNYGDDRVKGNRHRGRLLPPPQTRMLVKGHKALSAESDASLNGVPQISQEQEDTTHLMVPIFFSQLPNEEVTCQSLQHSSPTYQGADDIPAVEINLQCCNDFLKESVVQIDTNNVVSGKNSTKDWFPEVQIEKWMNLWP